MRDESRRSTRTARDAPEEGVEPWGAAEPRQSSESDLDADDLEAFDEDPYAKYVEDDELGDDEDDGERS
ncbi:MAG: hypothetical protein MUF35_09755 [Candidatus Nanopelagicales bacterium]|nr:hypothetical protein [Candidatus Nanopelagicales bacterium]